MDEEDFREHEEFCRRIREEREAIPEEIRNKQTPTQEQIDQVEKTAITICMIFVGVSFLLTVFVSPLFGLQTLIGFVFTPIIAGHFTDSLYK